MTTSRSKVESLPRPPIDQVAKAIHGHGSSMDGVAAAMLEIATAIREATEQRKPMDEFFDGATARLDKLCRFLVRRGPWILGAIPLVLSAVGAISPNAAKMLAQALHSMGAS